MRILRYEIEHHAAYPWQLVQGRVCHLRLRTGEALQSAAVLYGDPFWFSGAEKQPVLARSELGNSIILFRFPCGPTSCAIILC